MSMRRSRRPVCLAAVSALAILVAGLCSPSMHDLEITRADGGRLSIGALRTGTSWLGMALAQSADTTLENVTFEFGGITYSAPRVDFTGASLSRADLTALFDTRAGEPVAPRLARLSARQVRAPEMRIEQTVGGRRQVTVYRDIEARDIVDGRVASLTSASATLDIAGDKPGPTKGTAGRLSISDFDLAYAAALYGQKAGPQPAEARTLYRAFSLENLEMSDPAKTEIRIARIAGRDFKARPTPGSWNEAMRILGEAQDLDKAPPAERARVFGVLADLFDAFEIGSMEATGLEFRELKDKDQPVGRVARIAYTGGSAGQPADARVEGLDVVSATGKARIGTIAFTGFSFRNTLQGLKGLADKPLEKLDPADVRALVPTIGTMRMSGLDFDVPNEKSKDPKPENIRFGVKEIEVTADKPVNGIPTNMHIAWRNLTFTIPPNSQDEGVKDLAAMGYGNVDLSFVTAASWNEPGNELVIREVSVAGVNMGSAVLRGVVANVSKDVFNSDPAVAMVALIGATARSLDLTLENKGLFERVIDQEAKKQKKTPTDLRREFGMAAAVGVPAMLGNTASAKAVGQAVARFVAKPGRLMISARSKDPAGLGISDFAVAQPAGLLEKLEITATAE